MPEFPLTFPGSVCTLYRPRKPGVKVNWMGLRGCGEVSKHMDETRGACDESDYERFENWLRTALGKKTLDQVEGKKWLLWRVFKVGVMWDGVKKFWSS